MTRAADGVPQHHIGDQLLRVIDELAEKFHGVFSRQTVNRFVHETYDLLDDKATVRLHLVSLTARGISTGTSPIPPKHPSTRCAAFTTTSTTTFATW